MSRIVDELGDFLAPLWLLSVVVAVVIWYFSAPGEPREERSATWVYAAMAFGPLAIVGWGGYVCALGGRKLWRRRRRTARGRVGGPGSAAGGVLH